MPQRMDRDARFWRAPPAMAPGGTANTMFAAHSPDKSGNGDHTPPVVEESSVSHPHA
jgi:hypothetical protein